MTGIIPHPTEEGLLFARTDVGGAYRWDAGTGAWVAVTDFIGFDDANLTGIESVATDPSDPDRLYLAGGTYTADWAGNGAIFHSDDRGQTFGRVDMPFKMGGNEAGRFHGERLAVDPNDGRIVFFGTRTAGLWKSSDHGRSWQPIERFSDIATIAIRGTSSPAPSAGGADRMKSSAAPTAARRGSRR